MATIITNDGKQIMLDRTFLSSPTLTPPSQFKVGTGTNTPVVTDTDLQTPVNINGGQLKNFVAGFPSIDTVSVQATMRSFLNTLEANGNDLTEFGAFNGDGTPLLFSRTTHPVISKSTSVEVTYIEKVSII